MVPQPTNCGAATTGRQEAAAGKGQALRQSLAVPAQLSRYVGIRLGSRFVGIRLGSRYVGIRLRVTG